MGYGASNTANENESNKKPICKHCGWPIHQEPYNEFTVWCDYQSDGVFCGRRNKGLPHEPKDIG